MATILLTWELGGGAGHCVNLLPIAKGLLDRGHRVCVAARDLVTAHRVFAGLDVEPYPAAFQLGKPAHPVARPRNFAHILHNIGFESDETLQALLAAWRQLYATISPDVVLCEHAPSALLASRFTDARRVVLGTGFFSPPKVSPLPDLRPWEPPSDEADMVEPLVTDRINRMLAREKRPQISCLADLYADVDANFLLTFRELDQYQRTQDQEYFGMWPPSGGIHLEWPTGNGSRWFAYLKPSMGRWNLPSFVSLLAELGHPTLVYTQDRDPRLGQIGAQNVLVVHDRIDIQRIAADCQVAIHNGNAGTLAHFLLSGVPQLLLPLLLEQEVNSRRVVDLGAGAMADPGQPGQVAARLFRLLQDGRYADAAEAFQDRHTNFNPQESVETIVELVEQIVHGR